VPTREELHGVAIADDYRWLEDGSAREVQAWTAAQSARARDFLRSIPGYEALRARYEDLLTRRPAFIHGAMPTRGRFFLPRYDYAHKQQEWIITLPSLTSEEGMRTVFDPNELDPSGHTRFDFFEPSPDGSKLAVSISQNGTENGTLHVFDVETGQELRDVIPRVFQGTASGGVAWNADSSGFYYTRYPREGERPKADLDFYEQVWFHKLGDDPASDRYEFGRELPRIAEIMLQSSDDGREHLAMVQNGDGSDSALYYRAPADGSWRQISGFEDGIVRARFGPDRAIWAISKQGAPRHRVLRIPLETPELKSARVVIDQLEGTIEQVTPCASKAYVIESRGGVSAVRAY
jgi:prolyl oligopeptidase